MARQGKAPTTREIWDFLVGLKEVTEAGFTRVASEMAGLRTDIARVETSLHSDIRKVETRMSKVEDRLTSVEVRVARIEGWNLDRRFDLLEARVARLEPAS